MRKVNLTEQKEVGRLKEFSGTQLKAEVLDGLLAQQEAAALVLGHSRTIRLYVLPAKRWVSEVDALYGAEARSVLTRHVTARAFRNEATIATIVMDAVDKNWKPLHFGVSGSLLARPR
jgi:hypothetical protein